MTIDAHTIYCDEKVIFPNKMSSRSRISVNDVCARNGKKSETLNIDPWTSIFFFLSLSVCTIFSLVEIKLSRSALKVPRNEMKQINDNVKCIQ